MHDRLEEFRLGEPDEAPEASFGIRRPGIDQRAVHGRPPSFRLAHVEALPQRGRRITALHTDLADDRVREGVHEEQPRCDRVCPGEPALLGVGTASRLQNRHPAIQFGVGVDPGIHGLRTEPEEDAFSEDLRCRQPVPRRSWTTGRFRPSRMARATPSAATGWGSIREKPARARTSRRRDAAPTSSNHCDSDPGARATRLRNSGGLPLTIGSSRSSDRAAYSSMRASRSVTDLARGLNRTQLVDTPSAAVARSRRVPGPALRARSGAWIPERRRERRAFPGR